MTIIVWSQGMFYKKLEKVVADVAVVAGKSILSFFSFGHKDTKISRHGKAGRHFDKLLTKMAIFPPEIVNFDTKIDKMPKAPTGEIDAFGQKSEGKPPPEAILSRKCM